MSDCIDRDAITRAFRETDPDLFTEYDEHYGVESGYSHEAVESIIAGLPAADVAPLRPGRWIDAESDDGCTVWHCSKCSYPIKTICGYPIYKYCPMCGALMDGKEE